MHDCHAPFGSVWQPCSKSGHRKSPVPASRVRGCFALLIKLYAAGLPAYTVYLLTSILSVSTFYLFYLSYFSFFSQKSLTKVSLVSVRCRSEEIELQLFSSTSKGKRISHHIIFLIFKKSQSKHNDCSFLMSVNRRP